MLRHDSDDLTPETHAGCPGRGAFFRSYDPTAPVHFCADPAAHGHTLPGRDADGSAVTAGSAGAPSPSGTDGQRGPEPGTPDPARRLVIEGNRAWKAAAEVRKRWLTAHLFARRTAPREAAPFIARQLLSMPDPLRQGLALAHSRLAFSEITGHHADQWAQSCDITPAGRLPLLMLGPIAAAFEEAMTAGEGKNTWRPGRYSPCPRQHAGHYLTFLAAAGYQLSGIEQAVADGTPWTGGTEPASRLAAGGDPASSAGEADAAGAADPATPGSHLGDSASGTDQAAA